MDESGPPAVVGIGELLWDCFPRTRRPGGAPANMAWHATQLGLRGLVVSRVGRDEAGGALRRALKDQGLDLSYVQEDGRLPTGSVRVDVSDLEAPRYTIAQPAAWDAVRVTKALLALAARTAAVCFGTLFQRSRRSRETLHAFLDAAPQALRLYDVNLRQNFFERSWIEASLQASHAVKMNEPECVQVARILDLSPATPRALADALRAEFGVGLTCVTRGAAGCILIEGDASVEVSGESVQVADAVGAGDAFGAALLAARLAGAPLRPTARFANAVGARVASRAGAMPRLAEEYAALRAQLLRDRETPRNRPAAPRAGGNR